MKDTWRDFSIDLDKQKFTDAFMMKGELLTAGADPTENKPAGTLPLPIGASPRNSSTVAIVLAVNCPPQAPAPGQA